MNNLSKLHTLSVKLFPWFVFICVLCVYGLISFQLNVGTSVDEGFYLQGYLQQQPINFGVSQFHYIVRALFAFLPEDNALALRHVRFTLNIFALFIFALASYRWLQLKTSKLLYFSFVFLSGAMAFAFASPVLYYDNIQLIIYLLAFSILFSYSDIGIVLKRILSIVLGGLLVFALFNYLPSGILLLLYICCWFVFVKPQQLLNILLFIFIGIVVGACFYHFFIDDLFATIERLSYSLINAQSSITKHDSGSLLTTSIQYILKILLELSGMTLAFVGVLYLNKFLLKNRIIKILGLGIAAVLLLFLIVYRNFYITFRSDTYIIPLAFLLAILFASKKINFTLSDSYRNLIVFLMFLFIPLAGIFGTNQSLSAKAILFMPFWIVALFFLSTSFKIEKKSLLLSLFLCFYLFFVSYFHLVFFTRYHYYYVPQRSNVLLENTEHFKGIYVAPQQKEFIEKVNGLLRENGFQKNDKILAFETDLMTVYAIGGIVPNALFYGSYNMMDYYDIPPGEKIDYIMIHSGRETDFVEYLKKTNWGFPRDYQKYELGKYASNMHDSMNTILYIANK